MNGFRFKSGNAVLLSFDIYLIYFIGAKDKGFGGMGALFLHFSVIYYLCYPLLNNLARNPINAGVIGFDNIFLAFNFFNFTFQKANLFLFK